MIRKIYVILRDFGRKLGRQEISAHAASTAFFLFLSIVPMLMVICAVIPFFPLTEDDLVTAVTEITPDKVDPLVVGLISEVYVNSAGVISIAVVTTIWSAAKGVLALIRGLNAINNVDEKRNYFHLRIVAALYTAVMLLVIILSLLIMVFGNQLLNLIVNNIPQANVVIHFLMNFRFILVWVVLTVLFSAIYAYIPNKKLRFKDQIQGASFAAVLWSVYSWGFSLYVGRTGSYSVYGSLSIIVIVMIWMYFCMYIVMIGAYVNLYFQPANNNSDGEKK